MKKVCISLLCAGLSMPLFADAPVEPDKEMPGTEKLADSNDAFAAESDETRSEQKKIELTMEEQEACEMFQKDMNEELLRFRYNIEGIAAHHKEIVAVLCEKIGCSVIQVGIDLRRGLDKGESAHEEPAMHDDCQKDVMKKAMPTEDGMCPEKAE